MTSSSDAFVTKRHLVSFVCVPVAFLRSGWNVTETSFWYLPQVICKHLTVLNWGGVLLIAENKKALIQIVCSVSHVPFPSLPDDQGNPAFNSHYSLFFPNSKRTQMTRTVQLFKLTHGVENLFSSLQTSQHIFCFTHIFQFNWALLNALNTVFCVQKK